LAEGGERVRREDKSEGRKRREERDSVRVREGGRE
jgi:hypothetical protein